MTLETAIMTIKFLWPLVLGLSIVIIDNGQYLRAETLTLSASQRQQLRSLDAKIILPNYIPPGFRASEIKILAEEGNGYAVLFENAENIFRLDENGRIFLSSQWGINCPGGV